MIVSINLKPFEGKVYNANMPEIIQTNPKVLGGMPVIKGTRIPIARVVALYIQGYTIKDLKNDYPYLKITKKDLLEIFKYYTSKLEKN